MKRQGGKPEGAPLLGTTACTWASEAPNSPTPFPPQFILGTPTDLERGQPWSPWLKCSSGNTGGVCQSVANTQECSPLVHGRAKGFTYNKAKT